jgi:hypothetical protein
MQGLLTCVYYVRTMKVTGISMFIIIIIIISSSSATHNPDNKNPASDRHLVLSFSNYHPRVMK